MSNEQRYFDALRLIAKEYMPSDELRRKSERLYGLPFDEALEMAYDNVMQIAASAINGHRRPKDSK